MCKYTKNQKPYTAILKSRKHKMWKIEWIDGEPNDLTHKVEDIVEVIDVPEDLADAYKPDPKPDENAPPPANVEETEAVMDEKAPEPEVREKTEYFLCFI